MSDFDRKCERCYGYLNVVTKRNMLGGNDFALKCLRCQEFNSFYPTYAMATEARDTGRNVFRYGEKKGIAKDAGVTRQILTAVLNQKIRSDGRPYKFSGKTANLLAGVLRDHNFNVTVDDLIYPQSSKNPLFGSKKEIK